MRGGAWIFAVVIILVAIAKSFELAATFYLAAWGADNQAAKNNGSSLSADENVYRLGIYAMLLMLYVFFSTMKVFFASRHGVRAGAVFHKFLLSRVLAAPISFFDTTPLGRITNRFVGDLNTTDMGLSAFITLCLSYSLDIVSALVAVAVSTQGTFLILCVPIIAIYVNIQLYYRKSNTEMRRLEAISRSPVFIEMSQSLAGATSIRAFGVLPRFVERLEQATNSFSAIFFVKAKFSNWIYIRVDPWEHSFLSSSSFSPLVLQASYHLSLWPLPSRTPLLFPLCWAA